MLVYKAVNLINGKSYIGQTIKTLSYRKQTHFSQIKKRRTPFYNALKKYGKNNFKWFILEQCHTKESLDLAEEWYIRYFNTLVPKGYNLTLGGEGTHGWKPSEEFRKKCSEKWLGSKNPGSKRKGKSLEEIYGKEKADKIRKKYSLATSGENNPRYGKGYKIRGKNNPMYGKKQPGGMKKIVSKLHKNNEWAAKEYIIITPNGIEESIRNLSKYCREKNLTYKCMKEVLRGIYFQHKGYSLRRII